MATLRPANGARAYGNGSGGKPRGDKACRSETASSRRDYQTERWRERLAGERLPHLIRVAARGLARSVQLRLGEHSVGLGQWLFFCILWEADGLTQRELSEIAGVMEPTTVATLKGMEKLGYIDRRRRPGNKRNLYIHLTPKGRLLKGKLVPIALEVNDVASAGLSAANIEVTRRTLLRMIENLVRDEERATEQRKRVLSTRELARIISGKSSAGRGRHRRSPAS